MCPTAGQRQGACGEYVASSKALETRLCSVFRRKSLEEEQLLNAAPLGQPLEQGCCWF